MGTSQGVGLLRDVDEPAGSSRWRKRGAALITDVTVSLYERTNSLRLAMSVTGGPLGPANWEARAHGEEEILRLLHSYGLNRVEQLEGKVLPIGLGPGHDASYPWKVDWASLDNYQASRRANQFSHRLSLDASRRAYRESSAAIRKALDNRR